MKQAIIILLKKNPVIELIRKKYVPGYDKYEPHISLVYSFDVSNQDMLIKHIKSSVSDFSPFRLVMKGFEKAQVLTRQIFTWVKGEYFGQEK